MYKGQSVAVVITAYNEAGFVGEVIETLPSFVDRAYAVDDASTDGTWAEIRQHAVATDGGRVAGNGDGHASGPVSDESPATGPQDGTDAAERDGPVVVPIRHGQNRGVGAAIATGYERAYEDGMDAVAVMNGDGQMDPDILDRILDPVVEGRADYAKGNRLLSREHTRGMGSWRRFGNACLTVLTKVASGYWKTMDPQNGYTAISRKAIAVLDFDRLYDRYGFLNDILVTLNTHGMRVADVEMNAVYADESSSITYSRFIPTVSALLLRGFFRRITTRYLVYDFHPLVFLYLLAAAGFSGATVQAGALVARGTGPVQFLGSLLPVVLAAGIALALAMSFDVLNNEHLEIQELCEDTPTPRRRSGVSAIRITDRSD
jgi:glycosyltransferase involved in cell wall biosynthesis